MQTAGRAGQGVMVKTSIQPSAQHNTPTTQAKPWLQQAGESAKAYQAYTVYQGLEPTERSTERVAKECGKSWGLMQRWCTNHQWIARCTAYDALLCESQSTSIQTSLSTQAANYAVQHLAAYGDLVELMRAQVKQYMESGDNIRMRDVIAGLDTGIKGQRLVLGESTSRSESVQSMSDTALLERVKLISDADGDILDAEFDVDEA